ncbi:MAG: nucleotidyltransferase domain-containing protein [Candidatus Omnitrophota bacterium]
MRRKSTSETFIATNLQIVLSFLSDRMGEGFLPGEIQKATGISKAGVYRALAALEDQDLIVADEKGRSIYSARIDDPRVRQFKVLNNVATLEPLVKKISPFARKVVLYGSAARGEDGIKSDIDLFIVAKDTSEVTRIINDLKFKRKLQPVIKTAVEVSEMEGPEKVFLAEVNSGIILWEEKDGD